MMDVGGLFSDFGIGPRRPYVSAEEAVAIYTTTVLRRRPFIHETRVMLWVVSSSMSGPFGPRRDRDRRRVAIRSESVH